MEENSQSLLSAGKEFKKIFYNLKNLLLVFGLSLLFLTFLVMIPNIQTVKIATFKESGNLLINFFTSIKEHFINFRTFSKVTTLLIAILFGFNLVTFKEIRSKGKVDKKTITTTTSGLIFSFLGAGCGACGILAVSFLSFFGMGALVSALPLNGAEFDIVGVILLFISLILILNQSITKNNCKIKS